MNKILCKYTNFLLLNNNCKYLSQQIHTFGTWPSSITTHCLVDTIDCKNKKLINNSLEFRKKIHITKQLETFWERDRKSGYNKYRKVVSQKQLIVDGLKLLKTEIGIWRDEVKEKLESDPILAYRPGEVDVVWSFKEDKDFSQWVATSDSDHNEGYSNCSFQLSPSGHGLFSGFVNSKVTDDGVIKRSGYCNIKSIRPKKSFQRNSEYDWRQYTSLVIKLRGDGRSYLINIGTEGYFDIMWNDVYHYVLYTRGGPHWQIAKIPFSKFFYSSKGRIQDRQCAIPLQKVTSMGFSVGARGGHEGSFNLEIDYIGVEFDPIFTEEFAYELYKTPKYIVAT